jgi:hypothetical protein
MGDAAAGARGAAPGIPGGSREGVRKVRLKTEAL